MKEIGHIYKMDKLVNFEPMKMTHKRSTRCQLQGKPKLW